MAPPSTAPQVIPLLGRYGYALTVDVEEWYHTCLVADYVDPARRPALPRELDRLLPELLAMLAAHGARATFFTLGEVATHLPGRVREIAAAGHEVASHGLHHLRAGDLSPRRFGEELRRSKHDLEDLLGQEVDGYRAPEWSLRGPRNPRLRIVAELGFRYDSSLAPCLGSGRRDNPRVPSRLEWEEGRSIVEVPPLTFGGRLQLPAGGWPGRLAGAEMIARAATRARQAGGLPVLVVHPWELAARPVPGELTGLARWVHELGRPGFQQRFAALLDAHPWRSIREALGERADAPVEERETAVVAMA